MAAKKRRTATRGKAVDAHGFTVVLEEMRGHFRVFGEALQGLREDMGVRFEQVDARLEQVDARLEQVDARLGGLEHEAGLVKAVLLDHGRQLTEIRQRVTTMETKLDTKVDRREVATVVAAALSKRR